MVLCCLSGEMKLFGIDTVGLWSWLCMCVFREYLQDDCPPNPDLDTIVPSLVK